MENKLQQVIEMFQSKQAKPGGVSAPNAISTIGMRKKYNLYVEETAAMGEAPIPFEQWIVKPKGTRVF